MFINKAVVSVIFYFITILNQQNPLHQVSGREPNFNPYSEKITSGEDKGNESIFSKDN